ncbi:MAG: hypothetical protein AB1374_00875 [Bacillota bacterium]
METLGDQLEVHLPPQTLIYLREEARRRGVPVDQLVSQAIDLFLQEDRQARLRAAEALFQVEAPVADWEEIKREIVKGHLSGTP